MELSEEDVLMAESLISQAKVLLCQLEVTPSVTLAALKLAKKHGGGLVYTMISCCIFILFDMAIVFLECLLWETFATWPKQKQFTRKVNLGD